MVAITRTQRNKSNRTVEKVLLRGPISSLTFISVASHLTCFFVF